jgi:hypothetical protein
MLINTYKPNSKQKPPDANTWASSTVPHPLKLARLTNLSGVIW